jgi:hypothetical protein
MLRTAFVLVMYGAKPAIGLSQTPVDTSGLLKIHLDMRTVVSQGERLRMGGSSIGWEFGKRRDEITVGYYWTAKRGRGDIAKLSHLQSPFELPPKDVLTDVRFVQAGYWLTIRDWKRWKLATPIEGGFGRVKFTNLLTRNTAANSSVERIRTFPVQAAIYGEWKATKWLGTGIHVGYRHYISTSKDIPLSELSGLYYRFRVLLYMQTLYDWKKFVFEKEPLASPFF